MSMKEYLPARPGLHVGYPIAAAERPQASDAVLQPCSAARLDMSSSGLLVICGSTASVGGPRPCTEVSL